MTKTIKKYKHGGRLPNRTYLGAEGGQNVSGKTVFEKAVELEKQGKSNEQIRQLTGWFRNPHDHFWRYEISDKDATIISENFNKISEIVKLENKPKWTTLSGIYKNNILFKAYPKIRNLAVYFYFDEADEASAYLATSKKEPKLMFIKYNVFHDEIYGKSGIQDNDTNKRNDGSESRKNTLTHELQHAIQAREGVGTGSSALSKSSELPKTKRRRLESGEIGNDIKSDRKIRELLYLYNSGEIEARDSQLRINYTDEQRKNEIPYSGTQINEDYLNVEFEDIVDFSKFKRGGEIPKVEKYSFEYFLPFLNWWE